MDISLIYIDPNTRQVSLRLESKTLKGMSKLAQMVVLSLMNSPGQDILDPDRGGGIPEMVGMNFSSDDLSEVLNELTRRLKKTESDIITDQIGSNAPADEKLKELKIIKVGPGQTIDEVEAKIRIINELGQQSDIVV